MVLFFTLTFTFYKINFLKYVNANKYYTKSKIFFQIAKCEV